MRANILLSVYLILLNVPLKGEAELRVCSQNLEKLEVGSLLEGESIKVQNLRSRLKDFDCDVIALQELVAESPKLLERAVFQLATSLGMRGVSGYLKGSPIHLALLYKPEYQYKEGMLIPIYKSVFCRNAKNLRPALGVLLEKQGQEIEFIVLHLKSRAKAGFDSLKLENEGSRLCQAAGVAAYMSEHPRRRVILGDRNGGADTASALVLRGERSIAEFTDTRCIITPTGKADCYFPSSKLVSYFSAFDFCEKINGSFEYKGKQQQLDEILLSRHFHVANRGVSEIQKNISDHALVYADLE